MAHTAEWNSLLRDYHATMQHAMDDYTSASSQHYIEFNAFRKLKFFVEKHPEFKSQLPSNDTRSSYTGLMNEIAKTKRQWDLSYQKDPKMCVIL